MAPFTSKKDRKAQLREAEFIAKTFPHVVWINPVLAEEWVYTRTIGQIREIFPMFELTLDGLEKPSPT